MYAFKAIKSEEKKYKVKGERVTLHNINSPSIGR